MWPVLANLWGLQITWFGLLMSLAFVVVSFSLWRKMREDYPEEEILTFTIFLSLLLVLSSWGWHWWSVGGVLFITWIGVFLWSKKQEWDFWEWIDLLLPISMLIGVVATISWGPNFLLATILLLTGFVMLGVIKRFYRRLRWYKSGRLGFVGLVGIIWWNVVWILIAKWQPSDVYWGGLKLEQWIGIWSIIAACTALYLRAGRRVSQDWRSFLKIWQVKKVKNL
jgi:hypothetical protein